MTQPLEQPAQPGTKILVVDDHAVMRKGISALLEDELDDVYCFAVEGGEDIRALVERERPDAVVLDLGLRPGNGFEVLEAIRQDLPDLPVLVLSLHSEEVFGDRSLVARANGYLMKSDASECLPIAVRTILAGGCYLSDNLRKSLLRQMKIHCPEKSRRFPDLGHRDLEVLTLLAMGFGPDCLQAILGVTKRTVDGHLSLLKKRLGSSCVDALMKEAQAWLQEEDADPTIETIYDSKRMAL